MTIRFLGMALIVATTGTAGECQVVDVTPTFVPPSMSRRDIFRYYCATCHGRDARGDGPVAPALKTRPANLTKLAANNHGLFPIERVKVFITAGRPVTQAHGSSDMPVWGPIFKSLDPSDTITQARIDSVVAYLKSIQGK